MPAGCRSNAPAPWRAAAGGSGAGRRHAGKNSRHANHDGRLPRSVDPISYLEQNGKPLAYAVELCLKVADAVRREPKPGAFMLRRDDPAFEVVVEREMARIINDDELAKLYDKWFKSPLPSKNMMDRDRPMNPLLRDTLRFPTDKVGD